MCWDLGYITPLILATRSCIRDVLIALWLAPVIAVSYVFFVHHAAMLGLYAHEELLYITSTCSLICFLNQNPCLFL